MATAAAASAAAQPKVKDLIAEHAVAIAQLRQDTKEYEGKDLGGAIFDDLFVLRFLLSAKGDAKMAGGKLRETLEWRVKNADKLTQAARGDVPHKAEYTKHAKIGILGWLGAQDLVFVARFGLLDMNRVLADLTEDEVCDFLVFNSAYMLALVDARTRESGVLCKLITVVDAYGFSVSRFNRKFPGILSRSSHAGNVYFPQLLRCTVFLNMPTVARVMLNTFKFLMPKETVDKHRMCGGKTHGGKQTAASCPFLRSKLSEEVVMALMPPFMGGIAPLAETLRVTD